MMNSSKEIVKQIRKDATMPGATSGRMMFLNAPQRVSPKSIAASSKDWSRP